MSNTICKSFLNCRTQLETGLAGKGVDTEVAFCTGLKSYAAKIATRAHL